ncbi:MAG TPA: Ppx/GppA family phosphatase [Actinobacteria bacterium]|nr:Ppx/GppA family phosphatase [Actinomycetota bacterium]
MAAVLEALEACRATAEDLGAARVLAVATSATRDVDDPGAFLDAAEEVLGVRPRTISGLEEARASYRGVLAGTGFAPPLTVVDVGGGSTEIVSGGGPEPERVLSIDLGSVRLTDRLLRPLPADPDRLAAARAMAREHFAASGPAEGTVVAVGGTAATVSRLVEGDPRATIGLDDVEAVIARLAPRDVGGIAALGVPEGRADVILGGAIVLAAALAALEVDEFVVSRHDLLDGFAAALAGGQDS